MGRAVGGIGWSWSTSASSCSSCACPGGRSSTSTTRCSTTAWGPARGDAARAGPGPRRLRAGVGDDFHRTRVDASDLLGAPRRGCRWSWRPRRARGGAVPASWPRSSSGVPARDTTMVFTDFFGRIGPTPTGWCRGCLTCSPKSCSAPTSRRSLPLRAPARGADPPRPRRRLAAGGVLGERCRAVRAQLGEGLPGQRGVQPDLHPPRVRSVRTDHIDAPGLLAVRRGRHRDDGPVRAPGQRGRGRRRRRSSGRRPAAE